MKIIKKSELPTFETLKTLLLANILTTTAKWQPFTAIKDAVCAVYPKVTDNYLLDCLYEMITVDSSILDDKSTFPPVATATITNGSRFIVASLIDGKKQILKDKMMLEIGAEWTTLNALMIKLSAIPAVATLGTIHLLKDAFDELITEGLIIKEE